MPSQTPLVSLALVTMRPDYLIGLRAMLDLQTYSRTELIVVLHGIKATGLSKEQATALEGAKAILERPSELSLGECLNAAIAEARGDYVAKIDDDDIYGRHFLAEQVGHLQARDGDVVGKAETLTYLESSGAILLRHPGRSSRTGTYVAGPTLMFRRVLAAKYPFRDARHRVDGFFLDDCAAGGETIYSTSRRNFMYFRRADMESHTWKVTEDEIMRRGIVIARRPQATRAQLLAMLDKDAA